MPSSAQIELFANETLDDNANIGCLLAENGTWGCTWDLAELGNNKEKVKLWIFF